ncbi:hypothetical protein L1987_78638 [Smallanthus sonchifolius]|uniref:Uncharacterized protein n=1 Tax=Smallanthus sonchifolius TaxID=185202 RepID=A0ACB8ZCF6_9ASTR|nr:hypothetical protein L1987_78638 [Smallanthus sonchifolius]
MGPDDEHDPKKKRLHYPLEPNSYEILHEIGRGCSAIVYKALCTTTSAVVAIKSIDLDRTTTDNIRREAKTMSLLSHPNVLKAHCSFTVGRRLWVVMPFMSAGSLQSIMASSFPNGISENCISIILKETLMGLCYLHDQGHLHRDIKAGNILMDSNGSIKLADFGVSASVYESSSRCLNLNEITGTPYWMAPEVIHSYNGYSYKADIWSFGITALELAHGRPPLSHLPFSESLVMKITRGLRFSEYQKEEEKVNKRLKFSKYFKEMVGLCLEKDPCRRPTAEKLLKHYFFKNCKGCDFLVKNLLHVLPSVELRFKGLQRSGSMRQEDDDDDEDTEECLIGSNVKKHRRISGWNFSLDACQDGLVFPVVDSVNGVTTNTSCSEDDNLQQITIFPGEKEGEFPSNVTDGVYKDVVVESLMALKRSLDNQREKVMYMLAAVGGAGGETGGGDSGKEENLMLMQVIERLKLELENEKRKRSSLEMELEFLKLHITNTSHV